MILQLCMVLLQEMEIVVKNLEQEKEGYVIQFEETRNKIGQKRLHALNYTCDLERIPMIVSWKKYIWKLIYV